MLDSTLQKLTPSFFPQSYFNPCPRLIERDTNLFRWEFIEDVLSSSLVRMNKEHVVFTTRDSFAPPPGISTSLVLAIASDTAASFALAALGAAPGSAAKKAAGPRKTGAGSSSASKRQRVGGVGSVLAASPSSRRDNIVNNHRNIDGDYDDDNDNDNDEHNVNDPSSVGHKLEVDTASEDWAMNSTLLPLKRKREAAIPATLPPSSVYKIVLPPAPTVGTEASTSTAAAATSSSSSMVPGVAVAAEPSTLMVHLNAAAAVASAVAATTTITNSGAAALAAAPLAQDDTLSSASVVSSTAAKEDAAMALAFLINAPLSSVPETVAITGKSLMAAVELGLSSLAPRPIISDSAAAGAGAETILQVSPSSAVKSVVQADQSVAIIDEDVAAEMMQVDVAVVAAPPLAPAAEPVSADKRSVVAEDQYQPTDGISGYSDGELSEHGSLESSPDNSIRIGRLEDWAAAKTEQQSPSRSTKYEVEASSSSLVPLPMVEAKTDIGESGGNGGGSGSSDKDLLSKVLKYDQNLLAKVLQQLEAQGQTDVKK